MKLFAINGFERCEDTLTVYTDKNTCHIPLQDFEKWLKRTDRLQWIEDWSDHTGEHCQESGEYTLSQYWDMGARFISVDIYDFIVIHFVNPFENLTKTLKQIQSQCKTIDNCLHGVS
jgi:hypothetical protein